MVNVLWIIWRKRLWPSPIYLCSCQFNTTIFFSYIYTYELNQLVHLIFLSFQNWGSFAQKVFTSQSYSFRSPTRCGRTLFSAIWRMVKKDVPKIRRACYSQQWPMFRPTCQRPIAMRPKRLKNKFVHVKYFNFSLQPYRTIVAVINSMIWRRFKITH